MVIVNNPEFPEYLRRLSTRAANCLWNLHHGEKVDLFSLRRDKRTYLLLVGLSNCGRRTITEIWDLLLEGPEVVPPFTLPKSARPYVKGDRTESRKLRLRSAMSDFNARIEALQSTATVIVGAEDFRLLTEDNPDFILTGAAKDSAEYMNGLKYGIRIDREEP